MLVVMSVELVLAAQAITAAASTRLTPVLCWSHHGHLMVASQRSGSTRRWVASSSMLTASQLSSEPMSPVRHSKAEVAIEKLGPVVEVVGGDDRMLETTFAHLQQGLGEQAAPKALALCRVQP